MVPHRTKSILRLLAAPATILILAGAGGAQAATPPVKLLLSSRYGREVNLTRVNAQDGSLLEDLCTVESKDTCQPGMESTIAGGFTFPEGVAVNSDPASPDFGNVYVADRGNNRVQELTGTGTFVSMFGWDVNETKEKEGGALQAEKNVCTAASGNACKAGVRGPAAEQFAADASVAVDPATGNVYIGDGSGGDDRVDEYTASGRFVLMIGKEVNATTKANICTEREIEEAVAKCRAGVVSAGGTEHGAFNLASNRGDLLAVGGPEDLLYVGDEHRVQEFKADGTWVREISLTSISPAENSDVSSVAVNEVGDVYLVYPHEIGGREIGANIVRELKPNGEEVENEGFPLTLSPRGPEGEAMFIAGMAIDSAGQLAVSGYELPLPQFHSKTFGSLYDASTGRLITEFTAPGSSGIAFNSNGELYVAVQPATGGDGVATGHEILAYSHVPVAELLTRPAVCNQGAQSETSATFDCTLSGEANPEGVPGAEIWFQWGSGPGLASETTKQSVSTSSMLLPVPPVSLEGLRPNETFYYRLAGYDDNVRAPESPLTGERLSFSTPVVAPRIVGEPSVLFIKSASVVMFGALNPENANTTYEFQYGPAGAACETLENCPGVLSTTVLESASYGTLGVTQEVSELQPDTVYRCRLLASDENQVAGKPVGGETAGPEGTFKTGPAPVPQATTGATGAIGATSATVSGSINPDGQPAAYTFELGVYQGASTRYGVVFSGPAGAATVPVAESLALTGLQPGSTYAYRIKISSGYGTATGEAATFTTAGLPTVLVTPTSLALLTVPNIAFPKPVTPVVTKKPKSKKPKGKKARKGVAGRKGEPRKRKPSKGKK